MRVSRIPVLLVPGLAALAAMEAAATPEYARREGFTCNSCHVIPPKLNERGLAYQAAGYRLPDGARAAPRRSKGDTVPFATWITLRAQDKADAGASDLFLPKLELISGGTIGEAVSYFVEWRIVSQSLNDDGSFTDRGGRFEDAFLDWRFGERHVLRVGQHRSLNQTDVSLRLSTSEPLLFRNGLRVDSDPDPRIHALSTFSPSSRSPSIGYGFHSVPGESPADGLFHYVTVPFVGEFSIPLGDEASDNASFELGSAKGVYLETFYRRGHRSLGIHAFVDGGGWLATALGTWRFGRSWYIEGGLGRDDPDGPPGSRERMSAQVEYLPVRGRNDRWRAGAGLRVEEVSDDGRQRGLVVYVVGVVPIRSYAFVLQAEYRDQEGADVFTFDLSALF